MDELKQLWHTVFGDDYELIDRFFDTFYSPALCATKFVDGKLCAAAYVMPVGELVYNGKREKCAHIYAVAVYPEYRGRGHGIEVTKKAVELAGKAGYTAVLHPADEGLFGFYEKHCGFVTAFYTSDVPALPNDAEKISAAQYADLREMLLQDRDHIALDVRALDYFVSTGGELYACENACFAVDGGKICEYISRDAIGELKPFGMIIEEKSIKNGYFGIAFE